MRAGGLEQLDTVILRLLQQKKPKLILVGSLEKKLDLKFLIIRCLVFTSHRIVFQYSRQLILSITYCSRKQTLHPNFPASITWCRMAMSCIKESYCPIKFTLSVLKLNCINSNWNSVSKILQFSIFTGISTSCPVNTASIMNRTTHWLRGESTLRGRFPLFTV